MASQLKVDTITGVTTAGSIAVTGEGNSTTTNLQQGLVKSWINFNGVGTISNRGSFNVASLTDGGTGTYAIVFSAVMSSANTTSLGGMGVHDGGAYVTGPYVDNDATPITTTTLNIDAMAPNTLSNTDGAHIYIQTFGDLA